MSSLRVGSGDGRASPSLYGFGVEDVALLFTANDTRV